MVVHSYDEAKQGLLDGKMIVGDRQIGKTTALVDVIAEKHKGQAVIVVLNHQMKECVRDLFRKRHPKLPVPMIVSSRMDFPRGYDWDIYADLFNHFLPGDRQRWKPHLTAGILGK